MDEQEFKATCKTLNSLPCPFEKAILTRRCNCDRARRLHVAEREVMACISPAAQADCQVLLELLRKSASFTLKLTQVKGPLPHAKEIKVQIGGLLGLQRLVTVEDPPRGEVGNIYALVKRAQAEFGNLIDLPFHEIVPSIATFQGRRRSPRR
jgi:hypothetical protein